MPNIARYHPSAEMVEKLNGFLDQLTQDIIRAVEVPPEVAVVAAVEVTRGLLDFMLNQAAEEMDIDITSDDEDEDKDTVH